MARGISVQINLAGPSARPTRIDSVAEKGLRRLHAAIATQQRVDRLPMTIDCPVQIVPAAPHGNGRLVHPPRWIHRSRESRPSPLVFRDVAQHPAHYRRV